MVSYNLIQSNLGQYFGTKTCLKKHEKNLMKMILNFVEIADVKQFTFDLWLP